MEILKLGFTGTQQGMTRKQEARFIRFLRENSLKYEALEAHHGDCIGADADFHDLCREHWGKELTIVIHPPINDSKRAWKDGDVILPEKDYLPRNHDIVNAVELMVAAPKSMQEELRSGTWATVRYARKTKTEGFFLKP